MPVGAIFRFLRHSELSKTNMKIFDQSIKKAYKMILQNRLDMIILLKCDDRQQQIEMTNN